MKLNQKIIPDLAKFIEMRYGVDISNNPDHPELLNNFLRLQYWMDEVIMSKYFAHNEDPGNTGTWFTDKDYFETKRTGKELKDRLLKMNPSRVLDVGCGDNEWKKLLGGAVWGIDPYNNQADEMVDIMNFKKADVGHFNVVLALGSVNFGDEKTIFEQVERVVKCAKRGGKIFWRLNPGITHENKHAQWVDFYQWTEEKIREFAERLNCTIDDLGWDHPEDDVRWGNRYYSEWTKNS